MEVLVDLVGKNNLQSCHVSRHEKLVLIAKGYFRTVSLLEPFDSIFTLYNKEEDKYIYVTVRGVDKFVTELKRCKFPLERVFVFCTDNVIVDDSIDFRSFSRNEVDHYFDNTDSNSRVELNYDPLLYARVISSVMKGYDNVDTMARVHQLLTQMITIESNTSSHDEDVLKKCMHTLKYIDKYMLIVKTESNYFVNVDVLTALTAYMIYSFSKVTKKRDTSDYHML